MAITVNITGGLVQLTGNPIWIECSGASAPSGATEYKIMLRVISEDDKLEGAPFVLAKAPDSNGERKFNIAAYVDQYVKKLFQYPVSGIYVAYPTQAFNVQVQAGERYIDSSGNLQEVWGSVETDIIQMLKGGTNPRQISMMNDAETSFYKMYIEGDKFLTPRPWAQQVHPTQHVKLWYMVAANTTATFNVHCQFDDGTEQDYTSDSFTMDKDYLYEFNCNPSLHGITLEQSSKKVEFFDIYLDFSGTPSQSRRFYFDWRHCERPIFLFFANSLGGIDDVFFSGKIQDKFATEGKTVEYPFQEENSVFDPTILPSEIIGQNRWTFNTGWKPLTDMQYFRDLMLGQQVWYQYSGLSGLTFNIIPITIENAEKLLLNRRENIFSMELTVAEAHRSPYVFDNRSF